MNAIDTSDKSIKNSPFGNLSNEREVPANPFDGLTLRREDSPERLSTRASVFAALIAAAFCVQVPYCFTDVKTFAVSLLLAAGYILGYVVLWTVSFRFFESPDMMSLSVALNLVPGVALSLLLPGVSLMSMVITAAALTVLTLDSDDENDSARKAVRADSKGFKDVDFLNGELIGYREFIRADAVKEIVVPVSFAILSSALGVVLTSLLFSRTGASGKGVSILLCSLIMVLLSIAVSRIRGKDLLLSSALLSDASNLPSVKFSSLRSFFLRRLRYFLCFLIAGAGCILCDYLNQRFELGLTVMKYILCALMLFAFAFARGRNSKHRVQFVVELCVIYAIGTGMCHSIVELVMLAFFTTIIDVLITGMMLTHNRRLIMSGRCRYVEGMPLELMSVSIIIMVSEVMISYWGQILI